jgi:hypothetical protein
MTGRVPRSRWWQPRCPYRWYSKDQKDESFAHQHNCRLVGDGMLHIHICDCGAAVDVRQTTEHV